MLLKTGYWILKNGEWQYHKWLIVGSDRQNRFQDALIVELKPYHGTEYQ